MKKFNSFMDGFLDGVIDVTKAVGAVITVVVAGKKLAK